MQLERKVVFEASTDPVSLPPAPLSQRDGVRLDHHRLVPIISLGVRHEAQLRSRCR